MKSKSLETVLYSTIGVAVVLLIVVAVNFIAGMARYRADLTEEKIYTLSDGTKQILSKLEGKLKIRFYCTQDDPAMPVPFRNYAQRVDELLAEYKKLSGGKITIEKLNPQPATDAEDFAQGDGIEPRQVSLTDSVYLGLSFTYLDEKAALPFLPLEREKFLEYDISRAIAKVLNPKRPTIGIMSGLPIFGMPSNPMMMGQQPREPWVFLSELQQDFEVKQIQMDVEKIDDDINLLIVHHPKGISEKAEFAIDQFVLRGGRLLAFLDPYAAMEGRQNPMMGGGPQGGSTLEKLLKAWGLEFDTGKVLVDMTLKNQRYRPPYQPFLPSFSPDYIKKDEIVLSQLDNLVMAFPGAFKGTPAEGLKMEVLWQSSPNCQLVDRFMAEMAAQQVEKDFKSEGKQYAMAVRLSGKFKTAFPNGKPEEKAEDPDKKDETKDAKKEEKKDDALKVAAKENTVLLVADADMLHEQFFAEIQNFLGQKVMIPVSGNLTFLQNTAELLSGDSNLINARSRATKSRNFTLIREMRAKTAGGLQKRLQDLEKERQEIQNKLNQLATQRDANQRIVLSAEQKAEIEKYRKAQAETNRKIKEDTKALRREEESLERRLKLFNIAAMPLAVALFGIGIAVYNRIRTAAK